MQFDPPTEQEKAVAITRLVDGSLSDAERPTIEAWARERPEISRQVAAQRAVAESLRSAGPAPPERLMASVRERVQPSGEVHARRAPGRWLSATPAWRPAAGIAALGAVCAIVVLLVIGIGNATNAPSVTGAAKLAFAPSTGGPPAVKTARLLDISYGGVTFPNYADFAVVPTGTRTDRIGGRPALTVFYRLPNGDRLSYTVFAGSPVPYPRGAKTVVFDGVRLRTFSIPSGLAVVTLVRYGRTCVLAAPTRSDLVLALAKAPLRA
jgi:hypothetical protein